VGSGAELQRGSGLRGDSLVDRTRTGILQVRQIAVIERRAKPARHAHWSAMRVQRRYDNIAGRQTAVFANSRAAVLMKADHIRANDGGVIDCNGTRSQPIVRADGGRGARAET